MIHVNSVHLAGTLAEHPFERELPASTQLTFELRVNGAPAINVVIDDPIPYHRELRQYDQVHVFGHVRRRFFRVGGATQSRTEVVADLVHREMP